MADEVSMIRANSEEKSEKSVLDLFVRGLEVLVNKMECCIFVYMVTLYCFLSYMSPNDDAVSIIDNYYQYTQHIWLFHVITYIILSVCTSNKSHKRYTFDRTNENNNIVMNYHSSLENSYTAAISASVSKTNIYSINNSSIQAFVQEFRNDVLECNNDYDIQLTSNICATRIALSIGEVRITDADDSNGHKDDDGDSSGYFDEYKDTVVYYRMRLLHGSFRWFVWVTFNNIEEVYTNLVNTYPSVAVPKLIPMSTSQYDKLRNNTTLSNNDIEKACFFLYQFKNDYPRGRSYSSNKAPTETCIGVDNIDTNRIYHEKILILNWLKCVQNNSMLSNSGYNRQLFHLRPFVEMPAAAAIQPALPGSATKNKNDVVDDGIVRFTGNSYDNIRFNDESAPARAMYTDCSKSHSFKVRSASYLTDKTKVEAGLSISKLILMELFEVEKHHGDRIDHIASKGKVKQRVDILLNKIGDPNSEKKPFLLLLNIQIPGDPPVSILSYFILPHDWRESLIDSDGRKKAEDYIALVEKFIDIPLTEAGRTAIWETNKGAPPLFSDITWSKESELGGYPLSLFINKRFKLIPSVIDGPFLVQLAVKSTPVLLGQKVAQRYFRGENYLEIDVHVGSSLVAANIVGLCRGYASQFSTNMAVVIQGETENELPEKLLASVCLQKIDIHVRGKLGE